MIGGLCDNKQLLAKVHIQCNFDFQIGFYFKYCYSLFKVCYPFLQFRNNFCFIKQEWYSMLKMYITSVILSILITREVMHMVA